MKKKEIELICKEYNIRNYTINDDGSIDVDGDVNLSGRKLTKLPLKFRNLSGDFDCYDNQLTTLSGSPKSVGGYFYCTYNQLTTLEGSPKSVKGSFYCNNNQLTTLEGSPQVEGNFYCSDNKLNLESYDSEYVKSYIKQLNRDIKINELLNYGMDDII